MNQTSTQAQLTQATDLWPQQSAIAYVVAAILIITAVWIGFGRFHFSQHADSLVPVLVSLQHWTPYYWLQDRYGMLIPLLAIPIRNPLTNMMVQSALEILASLAASFLLVRYFFDDSPIWFVAAALQNMWLFLLVTKAVQFDWFVSQPYSLSMALGFAGLVLLRKRHSRSALLFMILSHWVNVEAFVVLIPLVLLRYVTSEEKLGLRGELGITAAGLVAGILGKTLADAPNTSIAIGPISTWPAGWFQLLQHLRESAIANWSVLWWMIIPAVLGTAALLVRSSRKYPLSVAAGLALIGVARWLFVGTLVWVNFNLYYPRYVYSSVFLFAMAMAIVTVSPFQNATAKLGGVAAIAATVLLFVVAAFIYGVPSRGRVQRDIDQRYGALTTEVLDSHATVVAGNYWGVWPAVFDANLMLYRRREHRAVYGLTNRAVPSFPNWALQRSVCAAVPLGDPEAENWMASSPRHFIYVRRLKTIDLYCEP